MKPYPLFGILSLSLIQFAGAGDVKASEPLSVISAATMAPEPKIGVSFTKPLLISSATNLSHYGISPTNAVITRAELLPDQTTVVLVLAGPVWNGNDLTVSGLEAIDGTTMTTAATVPIIFGGGFRSFDIGTGSEPSLAVTSNGDDFQVTTLRSGIRGSEDNVNLVGFQDSWRWLGWETIVVPAPENRSVQAGLMVRENLTPGSRNISVSFILTNGVYRLSLAYRKDQDGPTLPWFDVSIPENPEINVPIGTRIGLWRDGDIFMAVSISESGQVTRLARLTQVYESGPYWGIATAGEGSQSNSPAFVTYRDLRIMIGDPAFGLQTKRTGDKLTLIWSDMTPLESADQLNGPWEVVAGGISPYTVPLTGTTKFFRLKK